jgi:electron transfer flavoprotein beta subunit
MNILVILRAVQDPAGLSVNRRAQKVFINREQYIFNPSDRNALEAALQLGGEVTVLSVGGAPVEQVLRDARAMGAARAIQITDEALKDADALVLTHVLRRAVEQVGGVELVVLGAEVLDSDGAQIGPRLAEALDWAFIGNAHELKAGANTLTAIVARGRAFARVEADLPAVVAVAPDSNKPRYAHAGRLISVFSDAKAVEVWRLADLGLSESELQPVTERRGESFPPERELGKRLEGDVVAQLAETLRKI